MTLAWLTKDGFVHAQSTPIGGNSGHVPHDALFRVQQVLKNTNSKSVLCGIGQNLT